MIPGPRGVDRRVAVGALAAQVVHQVLAVDDEAQVVVQPADAERLLGQLAVVLVVVGHQDRDRPPPGSSGDIRLLGVRRSRLEVVRAPTAASTSSCWSSGSVTAKVAPAPGVEVALTVAAVALGDLAAQRQPDAGAGVLAAAVQPLEHAEDPPLVARVEADPVVADRRAAAASPRLLGATVDLGRARPARRNLSALERRFWISWRSWRASPLIVGSGPDVDAWRRLARPAASRSSSTSAVSAPRSTGANGRPWVETARTAAGPRSAAASARRRSRPARGSPVRVRTVGRPRARSPAG